jgi:hypothetical protein
VKKACLVHQQQGVGDLVFIQKILKTYAQDGYQVFCPIREEHVIVRDRFSTGEIRYPLISEQGKLRERFDFDTDHVRLVSDCESETATEDFTRPVYGNGFVFLALGPAYKRMPKDGLMNSKYRLAEIDFGGWQDAVTPARNYSAESALWDELQLKRNAKYTLINEYSSNGRIEIPDPGDGVYMRRIGNYSLFDWITVVERCSRLITVDTSLVLLAEAFLKRDVPMYMLSKWPDGEPSYDHFKPALRLPWMYVPRVADLKL